MAGLHGVFEHDSEFKPHLHATPLDELSRQLLPLPRANGPVSCGCLRPKPAGFRMPIATSIEAIP